METQALILVAVHLVLCTIALARIWNTKRGKRESIIFFYIWTAFAIFFPLVGPLMALAFVRIPGHDSDLPGDGPNKHL